MKMRVSEVALLYLIIFGSASIAQDKISDEERIGAEIKMARIKEALQKQDVSIFFSGKVVDQNDMPVEGARVDVHITHFIPVADKLFGEVKKVVAWTDNSGLFTVEGETGRSLYIKDISKSGYESTQSGNYQYAEHGIEKPFVPNKQSPVVIRMRKQGDAAACLETKYLRFQISVNESGMAKGYDFISQEPVRDLAKPVFEGQALTCDLQVKATINTNDARWTVVLSSGITNGGVIVSDKLLHEAPGSGYVPEYTLTPEDRRPLKAKYVYLKSREPAIYTRIELNEFNADKTFFRLNGKVAVTNPYGDRNLEQAGLPYEVAKQLADEAKEAFRQGKLPSKPDLTKLVKEFQERAEKAKQ